MKVGDEVIVNCEKKRIISMGYDDAGKEVYNVEGSIEDYYEDDLMTIDYLYSVVNELMDKCSLLYAGFFMHIRQRIVEPKGKELGKTDKEISQMTVDTINIYLNEKLDTEAAKKYIDEMDEEDKPKPDYEPVVEAIKEWAKSQQEHADEINEGRGV